jgi:hypothetical protein
MAVTNNVDSNVQNQIIEEQIRQQQIQQQNAVNPADNQNGNQVTDAGVQNAAVTDAGANAKIGELNAQADLTRASLNQQADQIPPKTTAPASPPKFSPANPYLKEGISDETRRSLIAINPANQSLFDTEGGKKTVVWGGMVAVGDVARTALINRGLTVGQAVKTALFGDNPMPSNMSYHIAEGPIQSFSSQHPYADNNKYYGNEVYVTVKQLDKTIPGNENKASDAALTTIKDRLKENITDWDVTKDDLQAIQNALSGLDKEDANKVISNLSPGELKKWADETNGLLGGYNAWEKLTLHRELSSKLDATNLTRINDSYSKKEDKIAFADEVARNASDDTKVNYAGELTKKIGTDDDSTLALTSMLGLMRGAPLETAIKNMSDTQLNKLSDVAIQPSYQKSPGIEVSSTTVDFNTELFSKFLRATSRTQDASVKTRVFEAGAKQIKTINDVDSLFSPQLYKQQNIASIKYPLTEILFSDTKGVVSALAQEGKGESLKTYLRSMIDSGFSSDRTAIGEQINRLITGNGKATGAAETLAYFEEKSPGVTGEGYYKNATNLGFYAGGIQSVINDMSSEESGRKDALKNILGTIAGLSTIKFPVGGEILNGVSAEVVDRNSKNIDDGYTNVGNGLLEVALPQTEEGGLYTGPAKATYDATFAATAAKK